jgi:hypothetical protein
VGLHGSGAWQANLASLQAFLMTQVNDNNNDIMITAISNTDN